MVSTAVEIGIRCVLALASSGSPLPLENNVGEAVFSGVLYLIVTFSSSGTRAITSCRRLVSSLHSSTWQEARADLLDYIEVFYNRARRHSHLGQVSPVEFEKASIGSC